MKNLFIYISVLGLLLSFNACDDFLDVNPASEVINDDMFNNPKGAEEALNGIYSRLQGTDLYGDFLLWRLPEILVHHFNPVKSIQKEFATYNYENSSVESRMKQLWIGIYEIIGYVNNAIINIERNQEKLQPLTNVYLGEAYGLRAYLHLELLKYFAPHVETYGSERGIPYVTTYSFEHPEFKTVNECYKLIEADLLKAKDLLKLDQEELFPNAPREFGADSYGTFLRTRESHMNFYAVTALLARCYWLCGDLDNAKVQADELIDSGKFPLSESGEIINLIAGTLSPKESIFGLYSTDFITSTDNSFYTYNTTSTLLHYVNGNITYEEPLDSIYGKYLGGNANADSRKNWFFNVEGTESENFVKWVDVTYLKDHDNTPRSRKLVEGISLLRITEMYYIAAEALLTKGEDPSQYIDPVLNSRGLTKLGERDPVIIPDLDFLKNERHKEFFGEGMRWLEMKKYNMEIKSNYENLTLPASNDIYVIPIPEDEFIYR